MATLRIPSTAIPGVTVLPFWRAPYYTPGGLSEVRAIVWHFAQGGGTDSWLTRTDGKQGNNSCHIVVKYTGAIRQLVEFDDASHSLHIDRPDGPPGPGDYSIFSLDAVQKALGSGWSNPNRYIIAIEVEGFWDDGANAAQLKTIGLLARYLERLFPRAVHLGHRDFQNYKPCPGPTLFRGTLPHGDRLSDTSEEQMSYIDRTFLPFGGRYTIPAGARVVGVQFDLASGTVSATRVWEPRDANSSASYEATAVTNITRGNPFILASDGFFDGWYISAGQVLEVPNPAPEPVEGDITQEQLDAAVLAATGPLKEALLRERSEDETVAAQLEAAAAALRLAQ